MFTAVIWRGGGRLPSCAASIYENPAASMGIVIRAWNQCLKRASCAELRMSILNWLAKADGLPQHSAIKKSGVVDGRR